MFYYAEGAGGAWEEWSLQAAVDVPAFDPGGTVDASVRWVLPVPSVTVFVDVEDTYPWDFNSANDRLAQPVVICTYGDINNDGDHTAVDTIWLVNFVLKGGPAPLPVEDSGDANCDGVINSADIIRRVNYIFKSGPEPGCP